MAEDTSNKRQWTLVQQRLQTGEKGSLAQFLRDNNFPTSGKFKSAFDAKLVGVKQWSPNQQTFIINEGLSGGKDLTQKKHAHLIPEICASVKLHIHELPRQDLVKAHVSPLEKLINLAPDERLRVIKLMDGIATEDLDTIIRFIVDNPDIS